MWGIDILKELDRRGAEMGLYEADWCELEVHDGVWFRSQWQKFVNLCSVPSQGAPHSNCQESPWASNPPLWLVSKTCCFEGKYPLVLQAFGNWISGCFSNFVYVIVLCGFLYKWLLFMEQNKVCYFNFGGFIFRITKSWLVFLYWRPFIFWYIYYLF